MGEITMTKSGMLTPTNMTEALEYAKMLSSSSMVPVNFKNKPADVLVAVQWGYEVGLPPMSALQNIAVINGKPSIYGDAALALITSHKQYAGHKEWLEGDTAYCVIKRKVGDEVVETKQSFSEKDAKKARLWGKQGPWSQYPERMLQMRARGFAMRDSFPDALKGVITVEEAQDYPNQEMKDITPKSKDNPMDEVFGKEEPENVPQIEPVSNDDAVADTKSPEKSNASQEVSKDATEENEERAWEMAVEEGFKEYLTAKDWSNAMQEAWREIEADESVLFSERRHEIGEHKKEHDDTIIRLKDECPDVAKALAADYKKILARLSVKAKEAGEERKEK